MKNLLFLLLSVVLLGSCKDRDQNPNVLPEATQSGKNTAGALVDGKIWVASKNYNSETFCQKINSYTFIKIDLKSTLDNSYIHIKTKIENMTLNKEYVLSRSENSDNDISLYISNENNFYYTESPNYIGKIIITKLNLLNDQMVCGTFEFKAVDNNGNAINITDGRFDKKFLQ